MLSFISAEFSTMLATKTVNSLDAIIIRDNSGPGLVHKLQHQRDVKNLSAELIGQYVTQYLNIEASANELK